MARDNPKGCAAVVSRPLHVLVVDDNPLAREVVIAYFTTDGHTAETATNGREGLTKFKAGHFDLVVTDGRGPEMGGYRLADSIKQYSTSVKIALFYAAVPWHALSSYLAKSAVSGHAQYKLIHMGPCQCNPSNSNSTPNLTAHSATEPRRISNRLQGNPRSRLRRSTSQQTWGCLRNTRI